MGAVMEGSGSPTAAGLAGGNGERDVRESLPDDQRYPEPIPRSGLDVLMQAKREDHR